MIKFKKIWEKSILIFTDTDNLMYDIQTNQLFYKVKHETGSVVMEEFVGLKPGIDCWFKSWVSWVEPRFPRKPTS